MNRKLILALLAAVLTAAAPEGVRMQRLPSFPIKSIGNVD